MISKPATGVFAMTESEKPALDAAVARALAEVEKAANEVEKTTDEVERATKK